MAPREIPDAGAAIRIGEKTLDPNETRWGMLLVLFMRTVAVLWIVQGLLQWHLVLSGPVSVFDNAPTAVSIAVVFFGVMDLLAAVGLWLATAWGGVLWLLVALSQIVVALALPAFFDSGPIVVLFDALLIAIYMALTYQAGREPSRRRRGPVAATRRWAGSWRFWERSRP